jgi:hypothetical protein
VAINSITSPAAENPINILSGAAPSDVSPGFQDALGSALSHDDEAPSTKASAIATSKGNGGPAPIATNIKKDSTGDSRNVSDSAAALPAGALIAMPIPVPVPVPAALPAQPVPGLSPLAEGGIQSSSSIESAPTNQLWFSGKNVSNFAEVSRSSHSLSSQEHDQQRTEDQEGNSAVAEFSQTKTSAAAMLPSDSTKEVQDNFTTSLFLEGSVQDNSAPKSTELAVGTNGTPNSATMDESADQLTEQIVTPSPGDNTLGISHRPANPPRGKQSLPTPALAQSATSLASLTAQPSAAISKLRVDSSRALHSQDINANAGLGEDNRTAKNNPAFLLNENSELSSNLAGHSAHDPTSSQNSARAYSPNVTHNSQADSQQSNALQSDAQNGGANSDGRTANGGADNSKSVAGKGEMQNELAGKHSSSKAAISKDDINKDVINKNLIIKDFASKNAASVPTAQLASQEPNFQADNPPLTTVMPTSPNSPAGNSPDLPAPSPDNVSSPRVHDSPAAENPPTGSLQIARIAGGDGQVEMRIGMRMPAFGTVEVHASVHQSQVGVVVGSEHGDLKTFLNAEIPALRANLSQQDLHFSSVRFEGLGSNSGSFQGNADPRRGSHQPPSSQGLPWSGFSQAMAGVAEAEPSAISTTGLSIHA